MICAATPIGSRSASAQCTVGDRHHLAVNLGRHAAVVFEARRHIRNVVLGLDDGFSRIARLERRKLLGPIPDDRCQLQQHAPAFDSRGTRPIAVVERATCGGHRAVDIGRRGVWNLRHDVSRRWIDDGTQLGAATRYERAVDEQRLCIGRHLWPVTDSFTVFQYHPRRRRVASVDARRSGAHGSIAPGIAERFDCAPPAFARTRESRRCG